MDEEVDQNLERAKEIIGTDQELVDEGWLKSVDAIAEAHDVFVESCLSLIKVVKDNGEAEQIQTAADEIQAGALVPSV